MKTVYHVTFTELVPSIREHGLCAIPGKKRNWVKKGDKSAYGSGDYVFVFENELDAHAWAGIMDWEFHTETGSGKISIITVSTPRLFEIDDGDPLRQMACKGRWLKHPGNIPAAQIIDTHIFTTDGARALVARWKQ